MPINLNQHQRLSILKSHSSVKYVSSFLALFFILQVQAQIPLPFATGFNTATEQEQWTQYRIGDTAVVFNPWEFSTMNPSLNHYYPVGGTEITDDWMVSDEFDFSIGASIDSIRFKSSGFGLPLGIDTIAMYVIEGHQHPDSATNQVLLKLFTDSTYLNDNVWKTFKNISIPPMNGPAFLAFRYQTIVNWLDVNIDDLFVTGGASGIDQRRASSTVNIYPNPVVDKLFFDQIGEVKNISIFNAQGQQIQSNHHATEYIDISMLNPALYIIHIESESGLFVNRFMKI